MTINTMRKLLVTLVAAIIGGAAAYAGSSTVNYNSSGSSAFRTTTDGTGNNLSNITIWDSAAGANGLAVNSSGQLTFSNSSFAATQSGPWIVQPGNTPNTTPWLMTISTALPTGANTIGAISNTAFGATQSGPWTMGQTGTWTVQPGNTANTTAWLVTGTGGNFPATQSGPWNVGQTGTWTVNPTTPGTWGLASSAQNVATPTNGMLGMGEYNNPPATITAGNASPFQLDANGNLRVNIMAGVAGGTASAFSSAFPSNGTAAGAEYLASPPTLTAGQMVALQTDVNGNLKVAPSASFGSAYPTTGTAIGVQSGTNMIAWPAKAANAVASTDVVPEVAVANTNPNGPTTMANSSPVTIASNQTFVPSGGAATTAAPSYTTGTNNPLSLDVNGNLRVLVTNANGNGQTTMANSTPVTTASDQRVSTANTSIPISVSTATTTQLVALSGTTKIYVTAYDVVAGGTGNITFEYGTGTNCATGTTALTGAYPLTAQVGLVKGSGSAPVLIVPAGNALCALTSAAVQMSGSLAYQQF